MKKEIRIYMVHPPVNSAEKLYEVLHIPSVESLPYKFVWDENEPQYLIANELIYYKRNAWNTFTKLYNSSSIKIFYAGECIAPDLNIFDYAICFDKNLNCEDRICRMPTRLFYQARISHYKNELEDDQTKAGKELEAKSGFCNFIYSNPYGHDMRKTLFETINNYKRVDSLGQYLNNCPSYKNPVITPSGDLDWSLVFKENVNLKKNYKFSIACENAAYAGYTSEKVLLSLEAHTVPIYWGNKLIAEDINEKAIVNCHNYNDLNDLIKTIQRVDEDDDLWCDMVSQPWLTKEQEYQEKIAVDNYYRFLNNIFMQPKEEAKRTGIGFHPQNYRRWFFEY